MSQFEIIPVFQVFDRCRTVYCPLGQIRNERGKCVFVMKKLYMQRCVISVKLTATISFSINDTFDRSVLLAHVDVSHLSHEWSNNWLISKVSYVRENENSDVTNSLIVELVNESPISDTIVFLSNIRDALQKQWTLKLPDGTLITMSADIFRRFTSSPSKYSEFTKSFTVRDNVTVLYRMIQKYKENPFPITQLYFCEHVELSRPEYELYDGVLFNKIANKAYFPGEYTMSTFENENVQYPARICVKGSGFSKRDGSYNVNGSDIAFAKAFKQNSICFFIVIVQLALANFINEYA